MRTPHVADRRRARCRHERGAGRRGVVPSRWTTSTRTAREHAATTPPRYARSGRCSAAMRRNSRSARPSRCTDTRWAPPVPWRRSPPCSPSKTGSFPPTANFTAPDPECDLDVPDRGGSSHPARGGPLQLLRLRGSQRGARLPRALDSAGFEEEPRVPATEASGVAGSIERNAPISLTGRPKNSIPTGLRGRAPSGRISFERPELSKAGESGRHMSAAKTTMSTSGGAPEEARRQRTAPCGS